jgi:hypothetical protein
VPCRRPSTVKDSKGGNREPAALPESLQGHDNLTMKMSYCQGTISGKLSVLYGLMERSALSAGHPGDVAQRVPLARMERQRAAVFGGADANAPRARSAVRIRCPLTGGVVNAASAMPPQPAGLMHMAHRAASAAPPTRRPYRRSPHCHGHAPQGSSLSRLPRGAESPPVQVHDIPRSSPLRRCPLLESGAAQEISVYSRPMTGWLWVDMDRSWRRCSRCRDWRALARSRDCPSPRRS